MKRQPRILAGTALGLLMASAPLGAFPLQGSAAFDRSQRMTAPLILAQSNCPEGESAEGCAQQAEPEQKPRKKRERQAESAPTEEATPSGDEQGSQRRKKREQQQQTESAPAEQAAPAEEQKPRRKKRDQQQIEAAPAEQAAPAEEQEPRRKKRDQQQIEAAPAEQAAPASDEQQPRRKKRDQQQQIEAAPAEEPTNQAAPANDEQQPRRKKRDQQQQSETAPSEEPAGQAAQGEKAAPANDNEQVKPRKRRNQDKQIEAAPAEEPARKETPAGEQAEPLPTDQQTAPAEGEKPRDQAKERGKKPVTGEQPSTGEQPADGEQAAPAQGETPVQDEASDPNAAPVFDSQKDAVRKRKGGKDKAQETGGQAAGGQDGTQPTQQNGEQAEAPKPAPVDQGPPPTDDRAAQQELKLERMVPVTEEKGRRVERARDDEDIRRRPRPRGVDVVRELGDRVILQFNNQTIVESDDAPRMHRGARNVYYEELSGDRTREIVERDNGIQIVTIRNRYGDVIQRSRIAPDGREYVLSYVDERHYDDDNDWRDPGDDLPPIRIDIPREEYILDAEEIEDPDDYYTFLEQPPVERVQRLYSIDEVKRSARVRDIARRIDLDTLNFEFGSASIPETEVQKLEGVASAMERLLEKNPAETFLIEGHTDAVGRPEANLALSDRRAEAVAEALTNAFNIPPENLTTQGYGEEYLKVNTSEPNRENRRVAIRRITSLVAPVASAN
ncbi:MAG: flagellar motor protein MotB [Mesorhizobium sp.]|uniref:OmpA family protein n=1 Tax=Mesorhizobium sp. TaxID=1871066 RepID=UPI000FE9E03A|nr:OmpA family protein [Mesorhizobium sp.]RWM21726.1 MAG: flagellar motor protein MotB [Mesorhizobium sp.]TIP73401.1 MAG: flagellar motor protein MotB [Mesorhizobium sp.]TIQ12077.1 MAG: flagellar motor protein MotB [Mesorhizobium sp.]TIR51436.1 MAG: flagellar motor protein MotB [Mesorhizobium sp.]TJV96982.1 MAG: flagellar motor protein MotB [Mesorhizobium sp.]